MPKTHVCNGLAKRAGLIPSAISGRLPSAKPSMIRGSIGAMAVAALAFALCVGGCSSADVGSDGSFGTNPITAESLEGLILEGEGPIPARLIYRSRNTISSEEDRLVLDAIAQELDKLVELAGRLDEAINDDDTMMEASIF